MLDLLLPGLHDRYRVEHQLGAGGMADVYRATDIRHDRPVAVKVLRGEIGPSVDRERFLQEIAIAARLQHPNILPVHDSGEMDGQLFYVMPYLPDGTLRARLQRERRVGWVEAVRIVHEVADALAHAHAQHVVHRDIKPENILFSAGHAMVADFGIAQALRRQSTGERLTLEGLALGTPEYMSPEQAVAEPVLDCRTDVYALGCVLYELLAGDPPFTGPPISVLARKQMQAAPPLPACDGPVPDAVREILHVALAIEPGERYATAGELAVALHEAASLAAADAAGTRDGARVTRGVSPSRPSPATVPSIAVLAFANLGADAADEYLSDGIADELIHTLSRIRGIQVVGRTSSFAFKGRAIELRAIGGELRVGHVLEGSVRRARAKLRVTARLVDVATGYERWSERYERELADLFAVQDEIAREITDALVAALQAGTPADAPPASGVAAAPVASGVVTAPTAPPAAPPTGSLAAYERYLQGRFYWNQRTETGLHRSVASLHDAIELDPRFALAHAALADSCITLAIYGAVEPATAMAEARAACDTALRLAPGLPDALPARAAIAALHDWRWDRAEIDYREAILANPSFPLARQSFATNVLLPLGRIDEALDQLARARALDPLAPGVGLGTALAHYLARDWAAAVRACQAMLVRDPQFGMAYYFMGQAQRDSGALDEAVGTLRQAAIHMGESSESLAALGAAYALAGDHAAAERTIAALTARAADHYVSPVHDAQVLTALGDHEGAIDRLYEATAVRATELAWLGVRPVFDALRAAPRFTRLVRRLGLAP